MSIGSVRLVSLLATLTLVAVGCSSDSTTSEEYLDLEREFGVVEQELAEVTAERDVLVSQAAASPADQSGSTAAGQIVQLLDDYVTALEERDPETFRATITDDFVANDYTYREVGTDFHASFSTLTADEAAFNAEFNSGWRIEHVGAPIVSGDGPWFVSVGENWHFNQGGEDGVGLASYVIIDVDGTLKVANHYWAGLIVPTE